MKAGDKVIIKPRDQFKHNSKYKHSYTLSMSKYAGEIFTIKRKSYKNNNDYYKLEEDEGFFWHVDWLSNIENNFLSEEEMNI